MFTNNTMQIGLWHQTRNRPMTLTVSVVEQMMARFRIFDSLKKVKISFKKVQCVSNRCKDLFTWKKYFWVRCTLKCWLIAKAAKCFFCLQSLCTRNMRNIHNWLWSMSLSWKASSKYTFGNLSFFSSNALFGNASNPPAHFYGPVICSTSCSQHLTE